MLEHWFVTFRVPKARRSSRKVAKRDESGDCAGWHWEDGIVIIFVIMGGGSI